MYFCVHVCAGICVHAFVWSLLCHCICTFSILYQVPIVIWRLYIVTQSALLCFFNAAFGSARADTSPVTCITGVHQLCSSHTIGQSIWDLLVPMLVCGGDDARVNLFIYKEGKVSVASLTLFALMSSIVDNCPLGFWESHLSHSDSRIPRDVSKTQYHMGCITYLVYHVVHWDPCYVPHTTI